MWESPQVELETKVKLYLAITVNFALWNGETWSGNKGDLALLDAFHHKATRRILNISMSKVKEQHLKNSKLRKDFGGLKPLSEIWLSRLLKFAGRTLRQTDDALSKRFLTIFINKNRIIGRPFRTCKDAMLEGPQVLIPSAPKNGSFKYWTGYANDELV